VLFEAMKNGYAFYLAHFNTYDVLYGSLGGILLFMLWTYLTSNILLLGAALTVEARRLREGAYAEELARPGDGRGFDVRRWLRSLVVDDAG
jgi:membrane protein